MGTISIEEAYDDSIKREITKLEIMKISNELTASILSFKGINSDFFLYTLFIENDVQKSKNYLYKIGMVDAYCHEILKMEIFDMLNIFTFPILSDSSELIDRYLAYHKTEYYDSFTTHFAKGIQSILKDDMPALEKHIDGLKRRKNKRGDVFSGLIPSFEGFYDSDSEKIISGIYELLKKTKRQYPNLLDYQYIHYEATAIAKLAWRKGMEIEIDNPLVPKELLPVKELEHYEGYNFFKELEND